MMFLRPADVALLAQSPVNETRDMLVAVVAIGLGLSIVYAAVTENARCFELASVRMMERGVGRTRARYILVGVGSLCLFMGGWLILQTTARKTPTGQGPGQAVGSWVGITAETD